MEEMEIMEKRKMSNKKFKAIWISILSVVLVLTLVVNILMNIFSGYVDLYLGKGEIIITKTEGTEGWDSQYNGMDYASAEEVATAALDACATIEGEGIVLMKNNGALPLTTSADSKAKVTILGRDAADPVYGGSGSGSVKLDTVVDFKTGLENANFEINNTVYDILLGYSSFTLKDNMFGGKDRVYDHPKANIVMDNPEASQYQIGEMPVENYTSDAVASFATYGDAAIIMYGRGGGEGGDLAQSMEGWDEHYEAGQHQLELNYDEKQLLALAEANFEKVIVVINASTPMELGILEQDENVDAVLWVGSPGQTGFNAVGQVLNGTINPSGRTADIYAADFTKDPTFVNFGFNQYNNISEANSFGNGYFVQYEEGIYVGYRYYETAAAEGFINYDDAVVYPFGYGLSYTSFDWEVTDKKLGNTDGDITVDVKVTNTGNVAGKDVVEMYYSAPYTKGGIEKSEVVLGDFAKTGLLEPGASETVTLTLAVEDMASYDYKNAKAYVLDAGDYDVTIQTDSHNIKEGTEAIKYTVDKTITYSGDNHRASDETAVTNQFDDVSALFSDTAQEGLITNMSRADFAGTFPTAPTDADKTANDAILAGFAKYSAAANEDPNAVMPTTGASNGLQLIDLRGVDYDDSTWDLLLDQLQPEEILKVVMSGAYNSAAIDSVGKPAAVDLDGPAGISSFMTAMSCTAYPSAVVIASTFNEDIAYEMGKMVGNEALANKVNGWYAPAMNMHRSPFAGRNFEYYSEDGVLAGKIGASVVSGAASKGVYAFIKHFALNDQETNRVNNGVSTWANEQAIREIYMKPFEISVKTPTVSIKYIADESGTVAEKEIAACTAVMSSFNRVGATWAGGSVALMQNVLRDEWGFNGIVITDFNLYPYMVVDQGIKAGSDLMLTFDSQKTIEDSTSATAVTNLRKSAHNILYAVVNSNAMNGIVPGTIISYTMATWEKVLIAADILIALFLLAGISWVIIRVRKNKA
jgi:beta-glucosidase